MAETMVVMVADGGCFGFFVVGCGCHSGASGGSSLWVFGGPVCVFFFFLQWWWPVAGVGGNGCGF